jgi:hypothetical protein
MTRFLQVASSIVRTNIMHVFNTLWHWDMRSLHGINQALLVLLPKLLESSSIRDFRPISLIHVISKLLSKVLANRLAPQLNGLIYHNQSTFIKGCMIHDNFHIVHASARLLHARRQSCLLFKVDITRAFDSVSW